HFVVDHFRNGKRIGSYHFKNGITNEGKNYLLDAAFSGGTPITTWYLGLIDNSGYSALAATDIYDNINQVGNGWDEFSSYTDLANSNSAVTRPVWTESGPSGQALTNNT